MEPWNFESSNGFHPSLKSVGATIYMIKAHFFSSVDYNKFSTKASFYPFSLGLIGFNYSMNHQIVFSRFRNYLNGLSVLQIF